MKSIFIVGAAGLLLFAGPVRAGQDEDMEQVIALASKGQDAQTSAQVRQYVEQNKDVISAILGQYRAYYGQIEAMANNDTPAAGGTNQQMPPAPSAAAPAPPATPATGGGDVAATAQAGTGLEASTGLQMSSGLQTSALQASSGLTTSHLAGVPALPTVDAITSVPHPDAAQLYYAAQVQAAMQARKRELMALPANGSN